MYKKTNKLKKFFKRYSIFFIFIFIISLSLFLVYFFSKKSFTISSNAVNTKKRLIKNIVVNNDDFVVKKRSESILSKKTFLSVNKKIKIAVIVVNFKDKVNEIIDLDSIKESYNNKLRLLYDENSYGQLELSTDVYGIYDLTINETCDYNLITESTINIIDNIIDIDDYDVLEIKTPYINCSNIGLHILSQINTKNGVREKHIIQLYSKDDSLIYINHEFGHVLGLGHANGWDCLDKAVNYQDFCTNIEYADNFDSMGKSSYPYHFSGYFKEYLGWISPENVITVSKSGKYTINPLELSSGKRVIKIPIPNTNAFYYIDNREDLGFDYYLPDSVIKGAVIYIAPNFDDNTLLLIDNTPDSFQDNKKVDFKDATLPVGKTFFDNINNISIKVLSDNKNINEDNFGLTVEVSIPNITPSPINTSLINLKASLKPNKATFYFDYPNTFFNKRLYYVDLSTDKNFVSNIFSGSLFIKGNKSPLVFDRPADLWHSYYPGRTIYWRVTDYINNKVSQISQAVVDKITRK